MKKTLATILGILLGLQAVGVTAAIAPEYEGVLYLPTESAFLVAISGRFDYQVQEDRDSRSINIVIRRDIIPGDEPVNITVGREDIRRIMVEGLALPRARQVIVRFLAQEGVVYSVAETNFGIYMKIEGLRSRGVATTAPARPAQPAATTPRRAPGR